MDTSSYLLAASEASVKLADFEANWVYGVDPPYDRDAMWKEFLEEGYTTRTNERLEYEQREAERISALTGARANVRATRLYFDPYADEVTAEMAETGFEDTVDSGSVELGVLGFMGRASGVGSAQDMYTTALQFAVANQNLRNDPSAWGMAKLTGASALFEGGFQSSLVKLAVDKFEVGRGGERLSTDVYGPGDGKTSIKISCIISMGLLLLHMLKS